MASTIFPGAERYSPGTGTYSIYYDTDQNPAAGLVAIATGLPQSQTSYDWQVPARLVGGSYTIYVQLQDSGVSTGNYAAGSLTVDPAGSDRLLSARDRCCQLHLVVRLQRRHPHGPLHPVARRQRPVCNRGGATHAYHVTRVPTLADSRRTAYDTLGNVASTTDSNGQATTYQYDHLSRLTHVGYADGAGVDYTYDLAGNVQTMHDATGWQIYGYDILGRMTSVAYSPTSNVNDPAALTIGYGYDADNHLTSRPTPAASRCCTATIMRAS